MNVPVWFLGYDKCTTVIRDVNSKENRVEGIWELSVRSRNFSINLKLSKIKYVLKHHLQKYFKM